MTDPTPYLWSAYAVTAIALAGYALRLGARSRRIRRALGDTPPRAVDKPAAAGDNSG
jgi:heme exporter protein D